MDEHSALAQDAVPDDPTQLRDLLPDPADGPAMIELPDARSLEASMTTWEKDALADITSVFQNWLTKQESARTLDETNGNGRPHEAPVENPLDSFVSSPSGASV